MQSKASSFSEIQHWSGGICDVVLSLSLNSRPPFRIGGGSENAEFLHVSQLKSEKLSYLRGNEKLLEDELILEIQNEKVAGWTSYDGQRFLDEFCRRGGPLALKTVKPGTCKSSNSKKFRIDYQFFTFQVSYQKIYVHI